MLLKGAVALMGICFGSLWVFTPLVVGELFGEANSGAMYGCLGVSPAVGSVLLNAAVAGRVYDAHALRAPPSPSTGAPGELECVGVECFRLSFLLSALATAVGTACSIVLLRRTRHMYAPAGLLKQ